jgi:hypothetical protein
MVTRRREMDAVEFARSIRELAQRAHRMASDGATREELIELRGRFVDALAAAPDGGLDVRRWIESAVERLDVQAASRRPVKTTKRYGTVRGTRRAERNQVRLVEA